MTKSSEEGGSFCEEGQPVSEGDVLVVTEP